HSAWLTLRCFRGFCNIREGDPMLAKPIVSNCHVEDTTSPRGPRTSRREQGLRRKRRRFSTFGVDLGRKLHEDFGVLGAVELRHREMPAAVQAAVREPDVARVGTGLIPDRRLT